VSPYNRLAPAGALAAALAAVGAFALWPQPIAVPLSEDTQHFLAFAVLAALWRRIDRRTGWVPIACGLLALGAAIEALQWLFTPRHAEWRDLGSDGVGVLTGLGVMAALAAQRYGVAGNSSR